MFKEDLEFKVPQIEVLFLMEGYSKLLFGFENHFFESISESRFSF